MNLELTNLTWVMDFENRRVDVGLLLGDDSLVQSERQFYFLRQPKDFSVPRSTAFLCYVREVTLPVAPSCAWRRIRGH